MTADVDFFVDLETKVWQALVEGDEAVDVQHLSSDFLGVYPSGFASRADHAGQLADGPSVTSYELHDARLLAVADDVTMLSYHAVFTRTGGTEPAAMYVSSLWCWRNDTWVNTFSQDTPAE